MSRQLADSCTVLIKNLKVGDAERVKDFACRKVRAPLLAPPSDASLRECVVYWYSFSGIPRLTR